MSVIRVGEVRRGRPSKINKLIAEMYRQGKCRECSVTVTRMNFAKILGKFTKVKIQYESSPREEKQIEKKITSPNTNARLRSNENGMVLIHRSAYKAHPAKEVLGSGGRAVARKIVAPLEEVVVKRKRGRPPKNKNLTPAKLTTSVTQYRIIFYEKKISNGKEGEADATIVDILPGLSSDILPTDEWLVDYQPRQGEPKKDLVYDRIAAELEDLMNDSKPEKTEVKDDFPSIMDLLNDALEEPEQKEIEKPSQIATDSAAGTGDVEAILRGDSDETAPCVTETKDQDDELESKEPVDTPLEAELTDTKVQAISEISTDKTESAPLVETKDSPDPEVPSEKENENEKSNQVNSTCMSDEESKDKSDPVARTPPSESLANCNETAKEATDIVSSEKMDVDDVPRIENEKTSTEQCDLPSMETDAMTEGHSTSEDVAESQKETAIVNGKTKPLIADQNINIESINYIIFKRVKNEECNRLVKCSKNLDYSIEMDGRPVELLGAPKYLSCVEDLRLMLQIVHESDLNSFNVVQGG